MKVAYFDCQFGAAGDMLIAALIDAGLPLDHWKAQVARIALPVGSFDVRISSVTRCTIAATKFDVDITPVGLSFDSGAAPESHHRHSGDSHDHGEHRHHHGHDHLHGARRILPGAMTNPKTRSHPFRSLTTILPSIIPI